MHIATTADPLSEARRLAGLLAWRDDTDSLIELYERLTARRRRYARAERAVLRAMVKRTTGPGRTRWLAGRKRRVCLELAAPWWNQRRLRRLWRRYPELAKRYLRVARLSVRTGRLAELAARDSGEQRRAFAAGLETARVRSAELPRVVDFPE